MSATGIYGFDLQAVQECVSLYLKSVTVNVAETYFVFAVPVGFGPMRLVKVSWVANAVLNDADGTILVSVIRRDAANAADRTLVNAASIEGGTANVLADFALAAETALKEQTFLEGDQLRISVTNNTATIDTNGSLGIFVQMHAVPKETAGDDVKHRTFYTQL